jgi:ABC-2 type transport system ATP-binding protein
VTNAAVIVSNLVKSYRSGHPNAVDGVSFEIPSGQVFGLLGPNGAGKTTTIKMILGLVIPTSGSIKLAGYDVSTQRNKALRRAGAVLEGSRNIYWRLSARANLEYFGALRGMHGRTLKQRIDELLALVELSDRADEETREFSRGMQQKVALAIAMLHDPDVLLLDEPTLGLDVQSARTIEKAIREMVKQGKAVLLTTHQMHLAEKLSDRIFVIHQGGKVAEGAPGEITRQFSGKQTIEIRLTAVFPDTLTRLNAKFPDLSANINGETVILTGADNISQADMLSLLDQLDAEGFPILQAGRREATLEEAFVQLTSEAGKS